MSHNFIAIPVAVDEVHRFAWPDGLLLLGLAVTCSVIIAVDARERVIPDACNLLVAALGIVFAGLDGAASLARALVQGLTVFLIFWVFRAIYRRLRGHHGLGLGDVKFLGAAGTWVGLNGLPSLILIACTTALTALGVARLRGHAVTVGLAIPFGPFLVTGLLATIGLRWM